jgi:hypothetical protein
MPYQESPYFETPCRTKKLWRYMHIDKFMAMLCEKALYFPNSTLFDDRYEGALSRITSAMVHSTDLFNQTNTPIKQDKAFFEMKKSRDEVLEMTMKDTFEEIFEMKDLVEGIMEMTLGEAFKHLYDKGVSIPHRNSFETLLTNFSNRLMFCNCWFLRETESHSMWAEYGDKRNPTSIAIQTTVENLIESIELTSYQIHIGEIKYKDYDKDHIEGYENFLLKNLNCHDEVLELFYAPVLHKRNIYEDEHEVRAIISFESICEEHLVLCQHLFES